MSLWGNKDYDTGNNKPLFANTSNVSSASTINGASANGVGVYGNVFGVSAAEAANTMGHGPKITHPGWVSQKIGTGPITRIDIVSGGSGINSAGYLIIADPNGGAGANASFTIANAQNTLQSFSANSQLNTINSITLVDGGAGYSNVARVTARHPLTGIANATFNITLGGRAGRVHYETLVAMGSITSDDPKDNVFFSGV